MKFITLMIGLLVVGCGTPAENTTKTKPVKEPTAAEKQVARILGGIIGEMIHATERAKKRAKVVGEYERKTDSGYTKRLVFLDNGVFEGYGNGKKREGGKWAICKGVEIHITNPDGDIIVSRINKDRSLTVIVLIDENGKREDFSREQQETYKKIK